MLSDSVSPMSQVDSQSTTDEIEPTQAYSEPHRMSRELRHNAENWPHDRQPGWSQYSDDSNEVVPCSTEMPNGSDLDSRIVAPETPESKRSQKMAQIEEITKLMESKGYTVFTHKTRHSGFTKTMHLAFCMYDEETA